MECEPVAVSDVVAKVATADALRAVVPRVVVPSRNVTVPVGVLVPEDGATVAVRVTDCPTDIVVAEAVKVVVVGVEPVWLPPAPEENS
jgi:hypothetical protein